MKILLTSHVFPPDYSAGTEVLTFNTARELQRRGHRVEVCTGYFAKPGLPDLRRFDAYEYEGIKVNRFFHYPEKMGGQTNIVELEYNNRFYARWFRSYLGEFKPDIVHFFHLGLLSASIIDVCCERQIPMVMTPTDFWLICPNAQLRLPDDSLCKGPDGRSVNCVKHAVANTRQPWIAGLFVRLPDWLVAVLIWVTHRGLFSFSRFAPMVRALSLRARFLQQRMNMLDKVIVPTRLMEEMLLNHGLEPAKVAFSRYGLRSTPSETRIDEDTGKLRIGFIGGLDEHKGAHLLISAVHLLAEDISWELKVYGKIDVKPAYFEKLQRLANGDERIRFCGTFPNEIIGKIFAELDVLVVPSIWYENTPLVIYSAQAAGCPVVASNLGGMAEVIEHERNGLLFEVGDVTGIARELRRLARDRKLLRQLSANAKKPKPMEDYVSELQDIYEAVLKERRGNA